MDPGSKVPPEYYYAADGEFTLKQVFLTVGDYARELLRRFWVVVLAALLVAGFYAYKALTDTPTYRAELTFMVNDAEGGGGMGQLGGLASTFGIDLGGGGGLNSFKVLALAKSDKIVKRAVFDTVTVDGVSDLIANHIINYYNFEERWEDYDGKGYDYRGFRFTTSDPDRLQRHERGVLKGILYQVRGGKSASPDDVILRTDQDEDTGIYSFAAITPKEELSIGVADAIYAELSKFYVDKAIEPQLEAYENISAKCDSIKKSLKQAEYAQARFSDRNKNIRLRSASVRSIELARQVNILSLSYAECIKNSEVADFALKNARPVFQVVDQPLPPISPRADSLSRNIVIGLILGSVLGAVLVWIYKFYRSVMSES